jgi:predicted alpha-1,2-mannosidase
MNMSQFLAVVMGWVLAATSVRAASHPVDEALPMVGTAEHGHAYPGAIVPFGMMQLSPDTPIQGWDAASGYHYSDTAIRGFSHTHLAGTGVGCLGDLLVMPIVGEVRLEAGSLGQGYSSRFSHAQEKATPGYYRVFLQDPQIEVELTATARCGFHKYTFPAADNAHIVVDLVHGLGNKTVEASLTVENDTTLSGSRISQGWGGQRAMYFVMQFSKPFASLGLELDKQRLPAAARNSQGKDPKGFVSFKTKAKEVIFVKVGISGTGIEGARKNLAAEIPGWNFNRVRADAAGQWKELLDMVQIETFDPHIRNTFYANLYLCYQAPILFNDVDGTYRGMDHKNHSGAGFQNYTIFSLWDTYRAEHPLLTLLQPGRVDDMIQSMLAEYKESGLHSTPIWPLWGNETWCMIGYHSVPVIVDAYYKGFRGFDAEAAYQAMRDTAMQDRNGLKDYRELGYVASKPRGEATSRTIEYAVDDWCLAKMAEALGHQDDAKLFYQRSANYRNLFDKTVGFFRGRKADGTWRSPFVANALVGDEYTEADAWQYAFGVQHDVPGLIALYGGDEGFIQKLDALFTADSTIQTEIPDITGLIGQYSQGDEQCHHVAYLYDYAGAPYKTQERVRQVMTTLFNDTPAGQSGNIDCGQMAAWYVFSALGFYPVNPANGIYVIGSPIVRKAVISLDEKKYHGRKFTVLAENNGPKNIYIQSAALNGKPLAQAWLTHDQITAGGTLRLVMGPKPNLEWGRAQNVRPPATMPTGFRYPDLPAPSDDKPVVFSVPIRIVCGADEPVQEFVPDPNMLLGRVNRRAATIDTSVANAAPAGVYQTERYGRDFSYIYPVPKDGCYLVRLHFAEIFDDAAGRRLENIYINGQPVLKDFDIFAVAGGLNKAVVKEFSGVTPDDRGNIVIRVTTTPNSPDKNAKISGLEIVKAGAAH